ncbi:MAG: hypothetical protein R3C11_27620 [Planctomycetaceae bacterium]
MSKVTGDNNPEEALRFAEEAIEIAKRNTVDVSETEMVSALGEAATCAGLIDKFSLAYDYIEEAFKLR